MSYIVSTSKGEDHALKSPGLVRSELGFGGKMYLSTMGAAILGHGITIIAVGACVVPRSMGRYVLGGPLLFYVCYNFFPAVVGKKPAPPPVWRTFKIGHAVKGLGMIAWIVAFMLGAGYGMSNQWVGHSNYTWTNNTNGSKVSAAMSAFEDKFISPAQR
jgi:hypothetical protein